MALLASMFFLTRIIYLWTKLRPHGLGRTEYIYWPTQFAMTVSAGIAFTQGLVISLSADNHSPIQVISCLCMGIAWVCLLTFWTSEKFAEQFFFLKKKKHALSVTQTNKIGVGGAVES